MAGHDMALPFGPVLNLRGFFDFNFGAGSIANPLVFPIVDNGCGTCGNPATPPHSTFQAGEFDLFITSKLSEHLSFLAEVVLGPDTTNEFDVDIERYQLTYKPKPYFSVSAGASTHPSGITIRPTITETGFQPPKDGPSCTCSRTAAAFCRYTWSASASRERFRIPRNSGFTGSRSRQWPQLQPLRDGKRAEFLFRSQLQGHEPRRVYPAGLPLRTPDRRVLVSRRFKSHPGAEPLPLRR